MVTILLRPVYESSVCIVKQCLVLQRSCQDLSNFVCFREYEIPPRFADPNSIEFAVANQWKAAYESEKRQREELEQQLRQARNNVVQEMETLKEQHQTELIRQELAHHQQEQLRLVQELRMRQGNILPPGGGSYMEGPGLMSSGYPMPGMEMNQEVSGTLIAHETASNFVLYIVTALRESFSAGQWWYGNGGHGGNVSPIWGSCTLWWSCSFWRSSCIGG